MNQELDENGDRNFFYKIFYKESTSGNANAELCQIKVKPTSNIFDFKNKITKEDSDLKEFNIKDITLHLNERAFRENQVFSELSKAVDFVIGSDSEDPLIVLISARDAKRLRQVLMEDILPKPDSERFMEILGAKGKIGSGSLYFVNREEAMMNLLKIHLRHYIRRTTESGGIRTDGPTIEYPLMDSLYGMGKSAFSKNYLAMIARHVSGIKAEIGYDTQNADVRDQNLARRIGDDLYAPGGIRVPDDMMIKCLNELLGARTLLVEFPEGSLADSDHRFVEQQFIKFVTEAIRDQFPIDIGPFTWFTDMVSAIPKPVFIILDELGRAFDKCSRSKFLKFLRMVGSFVSKQPGTYYVAIAKAGFFSNVGFRSEDMRTLNGDFRRIHLNPIKQSDRYKSGMEARGKRARMNKHNRFSHDYILKGWKKNVPG